jgi:hypothetical protein
MPEDEALLPIERDLSIPHLSWARPIERPWNTEDGRRWCLQESIRRQELKKLNIIVVVLKLVRYALSQRRLHGAGARIAEEPLITI